MRTRDWLALAVLCGVPSAGMAQTAVVEKQLDALLRPAGKIDGVGPRDRPVAWPGPRAVEQPDVPLSIYRGTPPAPAAPAGKPVVPHPPAEPAPLAADFGTPRPPRATQRPTEPLVRLLLT